jgi:hypothetical protein
MGIIEIQCPQCGASVERKEGSYFAKCRYCGCEVCFNEAKAEAEVAGLRGRVNDLGSRLSMETRNNQQQKKWEKKRNLMYMITCVMSFVGFLFVILSDGDDDCMAIGALFIISALMGQLIASCLMCIAPPPSDVGRLSKLGRLFKTIGIGFILMCGTAFISAITYAILDN